jgi:hypothetical protein
MMKSVKIINGLLVIFAVNLLAGCTWVKLTPEGEKVRVLSVTEISSCKKLGKTTVSLKSTIAGFERNEEKVKKELEILARNRAMDLGGDTVVPVSEISEGQQTFGVYRCVSP